jgi:hypothetical protein
VAMPPWAIGTELLNYLLLGFVQGFRAGHNVCGGKGPTASGRLAKDHSSGIDPLCGCVTFVFCKVPANVRYYFEGVAA